jgi:hypothetical protein
VLKFLEGRDVPLGNRRTEPVMETPQALAIADDELIEGYGVFTAFEKGADGRTPSTPLEQIVGVEDDLRLECLARSVLGITKQTRKLPMLDDIP